MTSERHRAGRTALAAIVALLAVAPACSAELAMPLPRCDGGSTFLVAQSVPSASLVPCLAPLPEGWSVAWVDVTDDGTEIQLDSDRAGDGAASLAFAASCDIGNGVIAASDLDGAVRFDDIDRLRPGFRARVHYRFDGGCLTWRFEFAADASATESVALEQAVRLVPRADLNAQLRQTFLDEDL